MLKYERDLIESALSAIVDDWGYPAAIEVLADMLAKDHAENEPDEGADTDAPAAIDQLKRAHARLCASGRW